jgi:hypothetical protein
MVNRVNRNVPGVGRFEVMPRTDHSLFTFATAADARTDFWGKGRYDDGLATRIIAWMRSTRGR